GAGKQGFGHGREALDNVRMVSQIAVARERANAHAPIGQGLDPVEPRQAGDVDNTLRAADIALHEVQQIGAASEEGRAVLSSSCTRRGNAVWTDIFKAVHAASPVLCWGLMCACAASTASTMPI